MKNDGKDAERAFVDHWESVGHCQRLRDKKDLVGLNRGAPVADFAKPSDFVVSSHLIALHYAEVKSTTDGTSFAFGKIQKGQSAAALMEARRGSGSYIFYIFSYPLGQWFILDCLAYSKLVDSGARSVKFKDLPEWHK
jgi:hypothetical protein